MYRHILVPVDNTELSIITIGNAVEFARSVGARITFFHAQTDHASSIMGDAEIVRLTAPEDYAYTFEGRAREILAKAESAARAHGVPCSATTSFSDTPYSAIIDAARSAECDLIFMASHGRRSTIGMMLGSQTLKVLVNSEIPVLVSAVANPPPPALAISIIRDEHRSLAAVIHAWQHLLKSPNADPTLMRAMVHYIQDFPVALHHPKEQEYLFAKLRERTSEVNAELDELEAQHVRDEEIVASLNRLVDQYADGKATIAQVSNEVAEFARLMWDHMGREEGVILPAAQRHLTSSDWAEINAAFSGNNDPRFCGDVDDQYRRLFSRIVNITANREKV